MSSLAKEVMEAISCQLIPRVSDLLDPDFKSRMDCEKNGNLLDLKTLDDLKSVGLSLWLILALVIFRDQVCFSNISM